ncbi:MAG TPA: hypothetical protein VI483_02270 [Candidatus Paceibacterota bacterium]
MTNALNQIVFASSLVEEIKAVLIKQPRRSDERGFKIFGPLSGDRDHMVVVLIDEGVDPSTIPAVGYKFPLPEVLGKGFLADIKEFPIS